MTALKIHISKPTFSDPGHDNPDFRGERNLRGSDGDHKATIEEVDPMPEMDEIEEAVLLRILAKINRNSVREIAPGLYAGLRIGLWDGDGRD